MNFGLGMGIGILFLSGCVTTKEFLSETKKIPSASIFPFPTNVVEISQTLDLRFHPLFPVKDFTVRPLPVAIQPPGPLGKR